MGADKGVHVVDDAIAGSDSIATSLVLAKAIEKIGPVDLVVGGLASTDAGMSVVPAMLAERLGLPQVTLASVVETQGDQIRIKRDGDVATEVIGGTLPLVLSVTDQSGEARYPSFKGIMAAKKKPLEAKAVTPPASGIVNVKMTPPPPRPAGKIVGEGPAAVGELLRLLKEEAKVL
jgi:electron transfer flavoprotein beta subunit